MKADLPNISGKVQTRAMVLDGETGDRIQIRKYFMVAKGTVRQHHSFHPIFFYFFP